MDKNRVSLQILSSCQRFVGDCFCIACKRQPPSLRNICSNVYFRDMLHFTFTTSTTFRQCVDAVVSGRVPLERLPPGFPSIVIYFDYDSFKDKFHPTCPGIRLGHGQITRIFELETESILALAD